MPAVLHFTAPRNEDGLADLNAELERVLEGRGLSPKVTYALQLALDELVSNIVNYGSGAPANSTVRVEIRFEPTRVTLEIESEGDRFDPFERPAPLLDQPLNERQIGGLGIHLTRTVMDECQHDYRDGRNVVVLQKNLALDAQR